MYDFGPSIFDRRRLSRQRWAP